MSISYNRLLHAVLDIGEAMQNSGAEISRVEDSINRMCAAYGVRRVNSFTITANIIVTLDIDDETVITQTRRIHQVSMDFERLDKLNDRLYVEEGDLVVRVSDDGSGMTAEQADALRRELRGGLHQVSEGGFGLPNIQKRIQLAYGPEYGIELWSEPGCGTQVTLRIPAGPEKS